jgi:hypothetical protein
LTYSATEKRTADERPCMAGQCPHLNRYHTEEGCIIVYADGVRCKCRMTRL